MIPTFSIIIPHKNATDLLQKCLDSIPLRKDVQVIVIDDNSDAGKVDFENFPKWGGEHYECYYTKDSKGAGFARNVGLEYASGEWILFIDSDDVFEPDFEQILDLLKDDHESDLVNFEVTSRNIESGETNTEIEKIGYHCNLPQYIDNPASFKYIVLTPWGKAIRRSLIAKHIIRFEEVKFGNDLLFATLCDFYCTHRRIIPITGYCWMYRESSLWRQKNLEWAIIRYNVLMNDGRIMMRLGEKEVANRFIDSAGTFLPIIREYSKSKYLKYLILYGIQKKDLTILLWKLPKNILKYIMGR